jgi:predicted ribosomally synthesized peptide with nif11-like leader
MSIEAIKAIVVRANNDKDFLRRLLVNPEEAVKSAGYDLTDQEIEMLKASRGNTRLNDEELEKRVNYGFFRLGP